MSLALLQTALLLPLELTLNRVLALDAASANRLARLDGRTLALLGTRPDAALYISVRNKGLHLSAVHEGDTAASLLGPWTGMANLLLRREPAGNLNALQLELRGDTAFVSELQTLLLDLDIDWEYQLSKFTGDIPASLLGSGVRRTRDFLQRAGSRLREDTQDFLHEETALFPPPGDLDRFAAGVTELTLRVDRLQARLALLETRHSGTR